MKTSEKIKMLRQAKGLSQEALGELVGVKKAAINKYETGRVVNIKRTTLMKLAEALDVAPADLLDDAETAVATVPIYEVAAGKGRISSAPDCDGQIVMVKVDGEENTLKRVQISDAGITLVADNPAVYPTKFFTADEVNELPVQIMGVVTKLIRDI